MSISNFNLGERIEAILEKRSSGTMGEWLGCTQDTLGLCLIDRTRYSVKRNTEVNAAYYWTIQNLETLNVVHCKDEYSLAMVKTEFFEHNNTVVNYLGKMDI